MRSTDTSTVCLQVSISKELRDIIKHAEALQNRTMTDFVNAAVQEAVENVIKQAEIVTLSLPDQRAFAEALLSPPAATPALEGAFKHHRKLVKPQ